MGKRFDALEPPHVALIEGSPLFFVATAAETGRVNVSPKGMDSLRVLSPGRIVWRNLTGSGNETAAHLRRVNRMTLMWCSFSVRPMILRAYGTAAATHRGEPGWEALDALFPPDPGARQVYDLAVELVQTSCGYAVPFMEPAGERDTLRRWAEGKGEDGVAAYWQERNRRSLDGFDTGMPG